MAESTENVGDLEEEDPYDPKVRWASPQRLDFMTFVGRDVLAVAHDVYIIFLHLKTKTELVYVANSATTGDGVDVVAGHKSNFFAFTEKIKHPRIFIVNYPSFTIMAEMKDTDVNRYKGLCMMESDLVGAFSGFPNYLISVWSWRTNQRLLSIPTDVVRRDQIYMASRTHMLICECWGEGLTVWEVAQCFKCCLMMKRSKEEVKDWEVMEPRLVDVCWSNEGQLYAVDERANLYSLLSDGIGMVTNLEWSENLKGSRKPCMCSFHSGILIYGPDKCIRSLKKSENRWVVAWKYSPEDEVLRLVSNSWSDEAVVWTARGFVYRLSGDCEERISVQLFTFKQRNVKKIQLIAPDNKYLATMNSSGVVCIYEVVSAKLVLVKYVNGDDICFEASPADPLLIIFGEVGRNYGMGLFSFAPNHGFKKVGSMCLTNQIVSKVVFSPTGRELVAAAMSAGHIFIFHLSEDYKLNLIRYTELGRGLADCCLMRVGEFMRVFSLVLFSDKYAIGERIICINAETGKDNKFAGKMAGPYAKLLPLSTKDGAAAVPHLASQIHVLKLAGDKGVTVSVKMAPFVETGHHLKQYSFSYNSEALITYGADGTVILRTPDCPHEYELQLVVSHRYEAGVKQAVIDTGTSFIVHLGDNRTMAVHYLLRDQEFDVQELRHTPPDLSMFDEGANTIDMFYEKDKNYLDLQEDKKVREEAMDYKKQREDVVRAFESVQSRMVALLEENVAERPLHQLSLSEFNLHLEHKKERIKQVDYIYNKKVREEAMDYKKQREDVVRTFESVQSRMVALLEENIAERPLHQLSLSEFNLHLEHKKERIKQVDYIYNKKVREEAMDYKKQREDVVRTFESVQSRMVALLEENIAERPLHQLSLSEFNLHLEHKKERIKQVDYIYNKKVREEAMDYKKQREDVVRTFESVQSRMVALLEENIAERPLHQLSLFEFNLHLEHKKERIKQVDYIYNKKVREEAMDYKKQREDVVRTFESVQSRMVALLEENIAERPLHQLSLSEFNLHLEHKKERIKQAEKERETIRLETEARIRAQDKVTAWIKQKCWDTMLSPRVKLFAIFSHYQVENYAVLPTQRDKWPELQQIEALRGVEMENEDLFRPWEEPPAKLSVEEIRVPSRLSRLDPASAISVHEPRKSAESQMFSEMLLPDEPSEDALAEPYVLSGSNAHRFIEIPTFMIPQTLAFSFLQMNWLQHIIKLNVQNMRLWFNKQFDDLMNQKKREVGLVEERNARLRFIIDELNKLSDLRGSFHHLAIHIQDPEWAQEEQPHRLIKVDPEECSIEPYISPSQVVVPPPEPQPKDDFRERALVYMMDGVLEKLWHEEIKKPIPMPQCMLEKDPENFNEDDLRLVFEYEAKVAFRNEERDKYRKMLHAEYAKLAQVLNEGVVKFNQKVKEMWLTKLRVDSVIGQENLTLMRLRRTNLDRVEMAEKLEGMRNNIRRYEEDLEVLQRESQLIQEQFDECQAAYEALAAKDKYLDRTFKNPFADLSPIIVDQCYKFFKKRPKWHQRATLIPVVLYDLANAVLTGVRPPLLHVDCIDYFKGVEQLDQISNMPPVMDEGLWATMCKLRRAKIENEIRMRAVALEVSYVEAAGVVWRAAAAARRHRLHVTNEDILHHRDKVELTARNKTIQVVLPAGQVEIITTGHMDDFEDATLIPREEIEKVNQVILRVGEWKLRMMRKQIEFRKGILSKEWEHAQMKMKLRHMEQELYSYQRLKIPKELQSYLKNKELGYTEEQEYAKMEKEMEASKVSVNKLLNEQIRKVEEVELKINALEAQAQELEKLIVSLNVKVSEKKLNEDPLEPIRIRRVFKNRMETLVMRSQLIRQVQANHTRIVMLQTELELLRLKTYPTLASFRTIT